MVLLLTTDLLSASQAAGAAARLGTSLQTIATPEALIERLSDDSEPASLLLLDLNAWRWDLAEWVSRIRAAAHPPQRIVAYGPHVHAERLAAAKAAGCDEVLTRGQFYAQMEAVLAGK